MSQGRLPFDPNRVKSPEQPSLFAQESGPRIHTVSQVTQLVKRALITNLPATLHVVGQISNISNPSGGHFYFTLKDAASELRCVMWRSDGAKLKFKPTDGLEVVAVGNIDVFEPRGQYQFYVSRLDPRGVGAMELAFKQLKEKLSREGLFEARRKRPLPKFPRRIGIITSPTGAAIRDILQTIRRRYAAMEIYVFEVRVQGEGAANEIADAIRRVNLAHTGFGGIDVLIVGRGGGSVEDLWAFNEEVVARAIFASAIPVVSAVGHEVDFTLADFVADVRAATPTAAAEMAVPVLVDILESFENYARHMRKAYAGTLESARARLALAERYEWFRDPIGRINQRHEQLDGVRARLCNASRHDLSCRRDFVHKLDVRLGRVAPQVQLGRRREMLSRMEHRLCTAHLQLRRSFERRLAKLDGALHARSPRTLAQRERMLLAQWTVRLIRASSRSQAESQRKLGALEQHLRAVSYQAVLERGFTITRRIESDQVVRRAGEVEPGDELETQTAEGKIRSRVNPNG